MDLIKNEYTVFNYSDIFFTYYFNAEIRATPMVRNHYLVYIYSGEYHLEENGKTTIIKAGECVFLRRDNRVNMFKTPADGEPFKGIFMLFKRSFLRDLYHSINKNKLPENTKKFDHSVLKLPLNPDISGLFLSMTPYFNSEIKPTEEMMNLKQIEGVYSLLNIDERFYSTLFDFTTPWKIDIMEFMEQNYMYDMSMEEFASFTGRSLSSFKRDFKQISDMTPQRWLTRRRLKAAHDMIKHEGKRVSDVFMDVGFKNLSHFSLAFKKEFGYSPGK